MLNAVFGCLCCIVLLRILIMLSNNLLKSVLLMLIAAFSFGFWRFATENENYIIPIFFSLLGSLFFVSSYAKGLYSYKNIILSGIFATMGCLYHQIHIFWFLGLFFGWIMIDGAFHLKRGIVFAAGFIIAPFAYLLVISMDLGQSLSMYNISHFVLHDYYTGAAGNHIGLNNCLLGGINLFRTFFQVHGQIWVMISNNKLWLIPGILTLGSILYAVVFIFKEKDLSIPKKSGLPTQNVTMKAHLLIFILQLLFAIYNIGNAEFMVMLPVLAVIILAKADWIPVKSLAFTAASLFIWNFCFGIYPNHQLHFNADDQVTQFIIRHPEDKFIAAEPAIILNQYYYQKDHWPLNVWPAPEYYQLHAPVDELIAKIDSTLSNGGNIYTDCTERPELMNRASLLGANMDFFKGYDLKDTVAVFETDGGRHCISKIKKQHL